MKNILLYVCLLCVTNAMAQNDDKRKVEFGIELTSELQAANKDDHYSEKLGKDYQNYNYVNLLRINVSVPISKSLTVEAGSISTCMTAPESICGDLQTFSNVEAGNIPFTLGVCGMSWTHTYQPQGSQREVSHSLFVGIRNMNEDYFASPATSFFTNSSCGIYPTISANYPIANYPVASMGVHYKYENEYDDRNLTIQASLYNGTGYHRFTGRNNIFRICPKDDGVHGIAEVSYTKGGSYYSWGNALYYNENMNPSAKSKISYTPWLYTEQSITPNLTLLAGCSHAFATEASCKDFIGCGVLYQLGRCQLGAFTDYANFKETDEFATELSCKVPISKHIAIQPTAHLITYDSRLHCVAMLRMALSL